MNEEMKKDVVIEKNDNEVEKQQPKVEEPRIGTVVDCVKLNVRKNPFADAPVITEIAAGTEVIILNDGSNKEFHHICTGTGIDGFCMKKFIKVK